MFSDNRCDTRPSCNAVFTFIKAGKLTILRYHCQGLLEKTHVQKVGSKNLRSWEKTQGEWQHCFLGVVV